MPVEDRLRHARRPRDLRGRRSAVAAFREDAHGGLDELQAALGRRHADLRAHAAIASICAFSAAGVTRTSTMATTAAANVMPALTSSAACRPSTNCCLPAGDRGAACRYDATMAPITAMPSAPPI